MKDSNRGIINKLDKEIKIAFINKDGLRVHYLSLLKDMYKIK